MSTNAKKIGLWVAAAAAFGAAAVLVWKKFIDIEDDDEEENSEEEELELPVPKETMIKMFSEISENTELMMMQLGQMEETLHSNEAYTEEMIHEVMQSRFEDSLEQLELKTYEMHKVNKDDVETASKMLENDRDFKRATYKLRSMFAVMNGDTPEAPDLPEKMTLEFTLEVVEKIMIETANAMDDSVQKIMKEKNITKEKLQTLLKDDSDIQKLVFESYIENINARREKEMEEFGIDKASLQIAMMVYQNDPTFQAGVMEINKKQQAKFTEIGFNPMTQ